MKILGILAKSIFILCIPILLLSSSIAWGFNSLWIYEYGFTRYNVSQTSGLSPAELEKAAKGMISYFNSTDEYVHITVSQNGKSFELFTVEEQIHLKDVKQLVWLDYRIGFVTLILVLGYALTGIFWRRGKYRRQLAVSVVWGCGLACLLILLLGIGTLVDFDQLFLQFHFLAFSNQFWSVQGYMIVLFGDLWYDAVLICIGFMAGLAIILGVLSLIYLKSSKKKVTEMSDNS